MAKTNSKQPLTPIDVKKLMLDKGIPQKKIAKRLRLTRAAVSMTLSGKRKNLLHRVARYVQSHK